MIEPARFERDPSTAVSARSTLTEPRQPWLDWLVNVPLAPGHWLERARGWRRWGLVGLYLMIGLPLGLLVWRELSLIGLPDIGDPFDVEAYLDRRVADDRNAFVLYRQAVARKTRLVMPAPPPGTPPGQVPAPNYQWSQAQPEVKRWLEDNREALDLWLRGTEKPEALDIPPREMSIDMNLAILQELRDFARLATLEAGRREQAGDRAGAYAMYRGMLRSARHADWHGTLIGRLIGVAIHGLAVAELTGWAADPRTDAVLLRQALDDAQELEAGRPPHSFALKQEYCWAIRAMSDPKELAKLDEYNHSQAKEWYEFLGGLPQNARWLKHEPERSRRIYRLTFANWLAYCDLPADQRPGRVAKDLGLFQRGPNPPPNAHALPPEELDRWFQSAPLARLVLPSVNNVIAAFDREIATHGGLIVTLAEELYKREKGEPPRALGDLVGPYLDALPPGYLAVDPPLTVVPAN